jgi:4-amino-4-deoxy-L-arabinose transferase-like glycosyltransferase
LSIIEDRVLTTGQVPVRHNRGLEPTLILLLVWLVCAAYEGALLKRGWVPHDDGTFASSAQRVLQGEMPHRDFDELYTGGLSYLNAVAFRMSVANFATLRWMLFLFFLAWVPAIFYIASRLVQPRAAALVTCLAVAASVPVYSAPAPSWYNLFFATFGTATVLRFLESRNRWWLAIAGLCAGLSFLAKISGLYFLAAVFLFFIFLEQAGSQLQSSSSRLSSAGYSIFITAGLLAFVLVLFKTVASANPAYVAHFVLPGISIALYLLWSEFNYSHGPIRNRFRQFSRLVFPVLAGFLVPIVVFLIPYARAGALHSFLVGVFISPTKRFSFAALHPTHLRAMNLLATAALATLLYLASKPRTFSRRQQIILVCVLFGLLVASGPMRPIYSFVWSSMVLLVPVSAVITVIMLAYATDLEAKKRQQLFLLICVLALTSLIQFPFAAPVYFCYVTPLVLLAVVGLASLRPSRNDFVFAALLIFYLAFWVFRATPGFIYNLGLRYAPNQQTATLALPRAGALLVDPELADEYGRLIPLIQQHATGDYIYAGPDAAEVYFLTGKRNPTRTLFDFLDRDTVNRNRNILEAISRNRVNVIAVREHPYFSQPLSPQLIQALAAQFPNAQAVGEFQVRWRQ